MRRSSLLQGLALLGIALASPAARAQAACPGFTNPLFVSGTTDVKPLLSRLAPRLGAMATDPITIVYQGKGSCTALDDLENQTDLTGTVVYWTIDGASQPVENSCTLGSGVKAQLALSDVTYRTCRGIELPQGLAERSSVVQGFGLVVPKSSKQEALTAQEGYVLFKYGAEAGKQVAPFVDPAFISIRTPASSTQLLIGLAVGVPGTMWSPNLTNINSGSSAVVSKVAAEASTGQADKTLGVLSLQRYDENRDKLKMLAFQSFGQRCLGAVLPDSTATALDKRNVRDGHYGVWGYLWGLARTDGGGQIADVQAGRFLDFLSGTTPLGGADPIADAARSGAIPACAMKVKRAYDGAALERYTPAVPCGCVFEQVATGATSCAACGAGQSCAGGGSCHFGYCEK